MSGEPESSMSHPQCWELLPWYEAGTLETAEQVAVEAHLRDCLICQRELQYLRRLGPVLRAADEPDVAMQTGLSETLARIDAAQRSRWKRGPWFGGWLRRFASIFRETPSAVRIAMAVQLGLVLVLGGLWLLPIDSAHRPAYETLSAPASQKDLARARLSVAFREGTMETAVRDLLLKHGARVVDGPSASGRYTVELPIPPAMAGPGSPIVARLRSDPRIIHAESLGTVSP